MLRTNGSQHVFAKEGAFSDFLQIYLNLKRNKELHPRKVTPALNMAMFGIYLKFLGCNTLGYEFFRK